LSAHRRYSNSPITEALIDIRVELSPEFKYEFFERLSAELKPRYPVRHNIDLMQGQFTVAPEPAAPAATTSRTKVGYSFQSEDKKFVAQLRINGFTFSRLQPYEHWESIRDEAHNIWNLYRGVAKPTKVLRVAVRYINRIDVPLPGIELGDYLRTFPEISPVLPQVVQNYLMQMIIPLDEVTLSLIQSTVPAPRPETTSINLDIDLFKESATDFDSDEKIWHYLEYLRVKKNEVFEGCITDAARAVFDDPK